MNTILYEEHRSGHRLLRIHFRRTLVAGVLPLLMAVLLATSQARPGPGHYAGGGLALAGLLLLFGLRDLHRVPPLSRAARWLVQRSDRWFPAALLMLQNFFIALCVLQLWFASTALGVPVTLLQHALLVTILLLSPLRRILHGTYPPQPSPRRELAVEFLRYLNASVVALFLASLCTRLMVPPGDRMSQGLPPGVILTWMPAVLVILGSVILFIDHVLRKMPPAPPTTEKDALD